MTKVRPQLLSLILTSLMTLTLSAFAAKAYADVVTDLDSGVSYGTSVQISQKNDDLPANDPFRQARPLGATRSSRHSRRQQ